MEEGGRAERFGLIFLVPGAAPARSLFLQRLDTYLGTYLGGRDIHLSRKEEKECYETRPMCIIYRIYALSQLRFMCVCADRFWIGGAAAVNLGIRSDDGRDGILNLILS